MAKTRSIQTNFLSGELSPLIKGNIELAQYYQGAQQLENVVIIPQGGVKRRAGTEFIGDNRPVLSRLTPSSVTMPNGGTAANIIDNDDATIATTTASVISGTYVAAEIDLGAEFSPEFVDIRKIRLTVAAASTFLEFRIQYSSDGAAWSTMTTFNPKVDGVIRDYRIDSSGFTYRYVRIRVIAGGTPPSTSIVLAGFDVFNTTSTVSNNKLIDFNTASDEKLILSITDGNGEFYDASSFINKRSVKLPYSSLDVSMVRSVSTENVLLLFHEDHPTQRIIFVDFVSNFIASVDDAPYSNVPQFDFNDSLSPVPVADQQQIVFGTFTRGQTYQIDVEGVLSKQITFAGDSTVDEQTSTAFNMQKNLQAMPSFGETGVVVTRTGVNQYQITIEGESAKDFELFSGFNTSGSTSSSMTFTKLASGSPRKEDVWSATRGYPRLGAFFGGRLWIGGTKSKKQSLFASKSGDLLNFDTGEGADDEGIFDTLTSRNLTEITDIYGGRNLQVYTAGGEYAELNQTVTPATINLRNQTSNGSSYVQTSEADGAVIFADKNGKTLREYVYTFNEDSYKSDDVSVLASHLIKNPIALNYLTGTSSEDANWLFVLNEEGDIAILNKLRSQDINGFTHMTMASPYSQTQIESMAVSGDETYFSVKRYTEAGDTVSTIERWNFGRLLDSSYTYTKAGSYTDGIVSSLSLSHLIGFEVSIVADGSVLTSRIVTLGDSGRGGIVLTEGEWAHHTDFEIGLNFIPIVQPMPINTNIGSGDNFMRLKKIVRMNMRVLNTNGIYIDDSPVPSRAFGISTIGDAPLPFSGILDDLYPAEGWSRDTMPVFSCPDPTPMHIQAIDIEVESS